jgi:hypothetical protein
MSKLINHLGTLYIKTSDGLVGVIVGETKTQILVNMEWDSNKSYTRFMKDSHRQVGTPTRTFSYVHSLKDV